MPDRADIPPSVAEHLDRIFADEPFAGPGEIGRLLRVGPKTLRKLGDQGFIRYRLKGTSHRQYAREDVEAYIRGDMPCRSTGHEEKTAPTKRRSGTTTSKSNPPARGQVIDFTAAQAKGRSAPQPR